MEKITFQTDDPEIIAFLYSLGRSRSKVLNQLIRDCMDDGCGYVSPRIMAETGFSYKNKKPVVPSSQRKRCYVTSSFSKKPKKAVTRATEPKPIAKSLVIEPTPDPAPDVEPIEKIQETPVINNATEQDNTKGPHISNPGMIAAGLASFGI